MAEKKFKAIAWGQVPTVTFIQGQASSFDLGALLPGTQAPDAVVSINSGTLPSGVTLDGPGRKLIYDGVGSAGVAQPITLRADEAKPFYAFAGDSNSCNANWFHVDKRLHIAWENMGGDWIDANGIPQGTAAINQITFTTNTPGTVVTAAVTKLVASLLANGNRGIYISKPAGSVTPGWASRYNATTLTRPPPKLTVVTSNGTVICPCTSAEGFPFEGLNSQAQGGFIQAPGVMYFDLTNVTGALVSAQLELTVTGSSAGPFPVVCPLYRANPPRLYYAPATEIGGVQQGIAAAVARDTDLASHPSVLYYAGDWSSVADAATKWGARGHVSGTGPPPGNKWTSFGTVAELIPYPEYGLNLIQCQLNPGSGPSIMTAGIWIHPKGGATTSPSKPWPWQRDLGAGYNELYLRYLLYIDPRNHGGYGDGVKLPGLDGSYQHGYTQGIGSPRSDSWPEDGGTQSNWWDGRLGHPRESVDNPSIFPFYWHYYGADHPYRRVVNGQQIMSGVATAIYPNLVARAAFRLGRLYCIEQHVKLNTKTGGTWNADGVLEVWVDGVKCLSVNNRKIRLSGAPELGGDNAIQCNQLFANIFQGGGGSSVGVLRYRFGGAVLATEYIGPPKRFA